MWASRRRPPWRGGRASRSGVPLRPPAGLSLPPDCRPSSREAAAPALAAEESATTLRRRGCRPLGVVLVARREGQPQRRPSPASRRPLAPSRLPSVVAGGGGPGPRGGGIGGHAPEARLSASRRRPPWQGGRASRSGVPLRPPAGLSLPPDCRPSLREAAAPALATGGSVATLRRCRCRPLGVLLRGGEGLLMLPQLMLPQLMVLHPLLPTIGF